MNDSLSQVAAARARADRLLGMMTLRQKIGQMVQVNGQGRLSDELCQQVREGRAGSIINEVDPALISRLQRMAREESEHGVPLLFGRDVIHGFKTIMPIPLGMAASWDDELVAEAAAVAAGEASAEGVNWTFSPMVDISRDPRWGRIAESFGEDPLLTSRMGAAMVRGYQRDPQHSLLSCLKHFVGYGASESGRDYNTASIPEIELRNVYLPPFLAGVRAGALSLMPSFSDVNGAPPSGDSRLLRDILRTEWAFEGFVVSDWNSITQLTTQGVAEDARAAARQAALAGVNMDMVSGAYETHLESLVATGEVAAAVIDELAREILTIKYLAGLFDAPLREYAAAPRSDHADRVAKRLASESVVLLKNDAAFLPLADDLQVCLIGPLADQPREQLGTWVFDADVARSRSLRSALEARLGERLSFHPGLRHSRDQSHDGFAEALAAAAGADVIVLALGEEAILSGEAHCRADISLPGAQAALFERLQESGKPVVSIVMAGRPLVMAPLAAGSRAIFYAWHPGAMAGPALADLLFGDCSPSGKLPATLPRATGQIPIYYAHRNTGRPPTPETIIAMADIEPGAPQFSLGSTSFHLDVHPSPEYPFGHGLSYTSFEYRNLRVEQPMNAPDDELRLAAELSNTGRVAATEVAQLYVRDPVASVSRPVRELKGYQRVHLEPGETVTLFFALGREELSFFDGRAFVLEPGRLDIWLGGSSLAELHVQTRILQPCA